MYIISTAETNPLDRIRMKTTRQLLPDPNADRLGLVDHPARTGPFTFDVLGSIFLFLDENDRRSLLAISKVCHYWRWVSNLLPQWTTALYWKLPPQKREHLCVRDECFVYAEAWAVTERKRKRHDADRERCVQLDQLRTDYDSSVMSCDRNTQAVTYVILIVLGLATIGMWIGAIASNREWPAIIEGESGHQKALRLRRFGGYPSLCHGEQYAAVCSDDNGAEYDCVLWDWRCRALADVIREGTTDARALWICQGDEEQLSKLERAANFQLVALPLWIVFASILSVATVTLHCSSVRKSVSSVLAMVAAVGMGMCSALMIASLPIIQSVYTTSCSQSAPTLEDLGWKRSDDMMAAFNAMSLLCAGIAAYLVVERELWVARQHELHHSTTPSRW